VAAADRSNRRPPRPPLQLRLGSSSHKLTGPALAATDLGAIDAVLLSHDHHGDNLDAAGRALLPAAGVVLTTTAGGGRLGGNARGLQPWATTRLEAPGRPTIQVTATPCRHGPPLSRPTAGEVVGFALGWEGQEHGVLWITGDTVLYDGVRQVADRLQVGTALLHLGCVRFPVTGPVRYSMTAREAVELCGLVRPRTAIPVHYEAGAISAKTDPPSRVSSRRRQPTSAAASAGYPSGRRLPSPRDHQPEEKWLALPSDTGSEGRSTAGCPAVARLVIPLVIPPAVTGQVRNALAGRPG